MVGFGQMNELAFFIILIAHLPNLVIGTASWGLILRTISNKKIPWNELFSIFITANLAKYLPGNFGHYIGRNVFGAKYGIGQKELLLSSVFEIFFLVILPFILLLILIYFGFSNLPFEISISRPTLYKFIFIFSIIIVLLLVTILLLYKYIVKYVKETIDKIKPIWQNISRKKVGILAAELFCLVIIGFIYNGILFYAIAKWICLTPLLLKDFIPITTICTLAGYSSILTPGVPGGIGVKESATLIMLQHMGINQSISIPVLIYSRVMSLLSEALFYAIIVIINKKVRPEN